MRRKLHMCELICLTWQICPQIFTRNLTCGNTSPTLRLLVGVHKRNTSEEHRRQGFNWSDCLFLYVSPCGSGLRCLLPFGGFGQVLTRHCNRTPLSLTWSVALCLLAFLHTSYPVVISLFMYLSRCSI